MDTSAEIGGFSWVVAGRTIKDSVLLAKWALILVVLGLCAIWGLVVDDVVFVVVAVVFVVVALVAFCHLDWEGYR